MPSIQKALNKILEINFSIKKNKILKEGYKTGAKYYKNKNTCIQTDLSVKDTQTQINL